MVRSEDGDARAPAAQASAGRTRPGERVRLFVALAIVCCALVASLVASCG